MSLATALVAAGLVYLRPAMRFHAGRHSPRKPEAGNGCDHFRLHAGARLCREPGDLQYRPMPWVPGKGRRTAARLPVAFIATSRTRPAAKSSSAGGITTGPAGENRSAPTCSPSRRSAISQRMVAKRARHRQVGTKVDADQDRAGDLGRYLRRLTDGRRDQADRQIVDEVRCDGDGDACEPGRELRRGPPRPFQDGRERRQHAGPIQAFDRDERPATNGSTDQEMSCRTVHGDCRPSTSTSIVTPRRPPR